MYAHSIKLINFRNHVNFEAEFNKINYIDGHNGSGKTSVLEAIYTAINGKSFRHQKLKKLAKIGTVNTYVNILLDKASVKHNISLIINNKAAFYTDKKKLKSIKENIFSFPVFVYSPENEGLLSKNQYYRLQFVDRLSFYLNKLHFDNLKCYNKLFRLKAHLLMGYRIDNNYLNTINEMICKYSDLIADTRKKIVEKLNKYIVNLIKNGFYSKNIKINYIKNLFDRGILERELLKKKVLTGTHKDKISILFDDTYDESLISFGQKKFIAILYLYAASLIVAEILNDDIMIILDDFENGLDEDVLSRFQSLFSNNQLIITGTENKFFNEANVIRL